MSTTNFDLRVLSYTWPNHDAISVSPNGTTMVPALVNEAIDCRAPNPVGTFVGAVVSAPGGSSATWTAGAFTPDVAGDYVLTGTNGSLPATTFTLRCFPAAALTSTRTH